MAAQALMRRQGAAGMPATEMFFSHYGLPAWLAWFDVSFEVVITLSLILGLYVPFMCIVSLHRWRDHLSVQRLLFSGGRNRITDFLGDRSGHPSDVGLRAIPNHAACLVAESFVNPGLAP